MTIAAPPLPLRLTAALWLGAALVAPSASTAPDPGARRDATVAAVERVMPAVVNIGTRTRVQRRAYYYDWWKDNWAPFVQELPPKESAGSGVIFDESGYVLTNVHVVEDADEIWVKISDGTKDKPVRAVPVVGTRRTDVAVLRLMGEPGEKFRAVRFAADDDLLLGETVVALGNPFGLGGSVSRGILSSKTRRPGSPDGSLDVWDWLQTDAAINPGNSGGPLINLHGELIGLNVAMYKQGQGIGFAIPVKRITETLSELLTPEVLKSVWFGAQIKAGAGPLQVTSVRPDSPAAVAGLRPTDQILQVNGRAPRNFIDCTEMLLAGDRREIVLAVQRGAERRTLTVRPQLLSELVRQRLGFTARDVTDADTQATGARPGQGVLITAVERDSPAEKADLRKGHLVTAIGDEVTSDLRALGLALTSVKKGDSVDVTLLTRQRRGALVVVGPATVRVRAR